MELNTAEQYILLAKHPEKYWYKIQPIQFKFGIIGAILLDLSLQKVLEIKDKNFQIDKKAKYKNNDYPGYERISDLMLNAKRLRKPRYWIQKFARKSRLYKWGFLVGLEKKRLIRIEHKSFLWIPF